MTLARPSAVAAIASVLHAASADVLHVPEAFPTIQAAVDAATDGDLILIAAGIYAGEGNTAISLGGKSITVRGARGAAHSIIDGGLGARAFHLNGGEGPRAVIEGLTISHGFAIPEGGGIRIANASPTIRDCVFSDCYGWDLGGAIAIVGSESAPTIERCLFADNYVDFYGGAVFVGPGAEATFTDCVFSANVGLGAGGGIYAYSAAATLVRCSFVGNMHAAIDISASSDFDVVNCLFSGNSGGGILAGTIAPHVVNSTFVGNVGGALKGGATVANSILHGNVSSQGVPVQVIGALTAFTIDSSDVEGGWTGAGENNIDADPLFAAAVGGSWTGDPTYAAATNTTTYTDDTASFVPGSLAGALLNPDLSQQRQLVVLTNSATTIEVVGNFTSDDLPTGGPANLVASAGDGYALGDARPGAGSPAIDAGDNTFVPRPLAVDLDGHPRIVDDPLVPDTGRGRAPFVDMGAYERQPTLLGDLDGDGAIDASDLALLLASWGSADPAADLDGSGTVDASDLALLLGAWTR